MRDHRRMIIMIQAERVQSLEEVWQLASRVELLEFNQTDQESTYRFIAKTLVRFDYGNCKKTDNGGLKAYLGKLDGP